MCIQVVIILSVNSKPIGNTIQSAIALGTSLIRAIFFIDSPNQYDNNTNNNINNNINNNNNNNNYSNNNNSEK